MNAFCVGLAFRGMYFWGFSNFMWNLALNRARNARTHADKFHRCCNRRPNRCVDNYASACLFVFAL